MNKKRSILMQDSVANKFKSVHKTSSSKKNKNLFDKKFSSIAFDFQKEQKNQK